MIERVWNAKDILLIIVNTLWNKPHDKAFFSPIMGLFYLTILTIIGI